MNPLDTKITDLAFRLLPAAQELARQLGEAGLSEAEVVEAVSTRMREISSGLSPELEFIATANWLGRVLSINRIDQTPLPICNERDFQLRIPDVLCIVPWNDRPTPILVEVKRFAGKVLTFTENYFKRIQAYAEALRMPLLVAWKWGGKWLLVDSRHFERKVTAYKLTLEKAFGENLMSYLFGDCLIQLTQRIAFYLDFTVSDFPLPLPQPPAILPEGNYKMTIKGAGYLLDNNPVKLSNNLSWLFLRSPDDSVVEVTGPDTVRALHTPQPDAMFSLGDFAVMMLLWREKDDEPDWESAVRRTAPIKSSEIRAELEQGIQQGVVRYVLNQVPQTMPDFLPQVAADQNPI